MTSIDESTITTPSPDVVTTVPPATPTGDLITALCGTAMMLGTLSGAWAHNNIIKTLDSFFTPWHALLYAGFAATGAWTFFLAYRRRHAARVSDRGDGRGLHRHRGRGDRRRAPAPAG